MSPRAIKDAAFKLLSNRVHALVRTDNGAADRGVTAEEMCVIERIQDQVENDDGYHDGVLTVHVARIERLIISRRSSSSSGTSSSPVPGRRKSVSWGLP